MEVTLPKDVLSSLFNWVESAVIFRLILTSTELKQLTLSSVRHLTFGSHTVRWTKLLKDGITLSSLYSVSLHAYWTTPEEVGLVLRSAPRLAKLSLAPNLPHQPPFISHIHNPLCSALRRHPRLHSVRLLNVKGGANRFVQFLPTQLSSLHLISIDGPVKDELFADIHTACPNLSTLVVFGRSSLRTLQGLSHLTFPSLDHQITASAFIYIKQMSNLRKLRLNKASLALKLAPANRQAFVALLESLLPVAPNKIWRELTLGEFEGDDLFGHFADDLPALRDATHRLGLRPTLLALRWRCLNQASFWKHSDEVQLRFFQFLTDDLQMHAADCPCTSSSTCSKCGTWAAQIPSFQPRAAAYIIENHFLPAIARRIAGDPGVDPNRLASILLDNFLAREQVEETVRNYIHNPALPLAVDYSSLTLLPAVLQLHHESTLRALIARANEMQSSLGLAQEFEAHRLEEMGLDQLFAVAAVEPTFFFFNLSWFTTLKYNTEEVLRLAQECALDVAEKLRLLDLADPFGADVFDQGAFDVDQLFAVLLTVLSPDEFREYIEGRVVEAPVPGHVLRWLLSHGHGDNFNALRGKNGENWLHHQLPSILLTEEIAETPLDRDLLVAVDAAGDTPLHCLRSLRWDEEGLATVYRGLVPHLAFLEEQKVLEARNKAGATPLPIPDTNPTLSLGDDDSKAALAIVKRYYPEAKLK